MANADEALREAGWDPDVKKVYGLGMLPSFMNSTAVVAGSPS